VRIAFSTLPFRRLSLIDAFDAMADLGIKQVELCVDSHHSDSNCWNKPIEEIVYLKNNLDININSIHVPLTKRSNSVKLSDLRNIWTETATNAIDLAACLKAEFIVQHVYSLKYSANKGQGNIAPEDILPDLKSVLSYAEKKCVKVALENVSTPFCGMLGAGVKETVELINLFPNDPIGICLDVTHSMAAGIDPIEALELIDINNLMSIHASDNYYNSFKDQHLPIGKGEIDWEVFFNRLDSKGFKGTLVIEVDEKEKKERCLIDSIEYLRYLEIID